MDKSKRSCSISAGVIIISKRFECFGRVGGDSLSGPDWFGVSDTPGPERFSAALRPVGDVVGASYRACFYKDSVRERK